MELRRLPTDIFRLIAHYAGSIALARLNATFDRSIQKLLQTPHMVSALKILPTFAQQLSDLSYLYWSLGPVKHLLLEMRSPINFEDFSFISRLNALELTLVRSQAANRRSSSMYSHSAFDSNEHHVETKAILVAIGQPDFQRLLPNLRCLNFERQLFFAPPRANTLAEPTPYDLIFPPSLTSLRFDYIDSLLFTSVIRALPPTLRELTAFPIKPTPFFGQPEVDDSEGDWLRLIFEKSPTIEVIDVAMRCFAADGVTELPKTLHTLIVAYHVGNVLKTLENINLCVSHLSRLTIHEKSSLFSEEKSRSPISLSALLPRTLEVLHLMDPAAWSVSEGGESTIDLPQSLTELVLAVPANVQPAALANIGALKHLTLLNLSVDLSCNICLVDGASDHPEFGAHISSSEVKQAVKLSSSSLPRHLTDLSLKVLNNMSEGAIRSLPPKLVRLSVPSFPLSRHHVLAELAPNCVLYLTSEVRLWSSSNGAWLTQGVFEPFWSAHLDVNLWRAAVLRWKARAKVAFGLSLGSYPEKDSDYAKYPSNVESIQVADAWDPEGFSWGKFIRFNYLMRECKSLTSMSLNVGIKERMTSVLNSKLIPPSLTRLDLHDSLIEIIIDEECPLRYFSSSRTFVPPAGTLRGSPPHLTSLDTPNWVINFTDIESWNFKDMERLALRITTIEDYKVIDFLTNRVNAKTRSNMQVVISYHPTGALLPDEGPDSLRCVNWDEICRLTPSIMNARLLEAVPSELAQPAPFGSQPSLNPTETIGRVVKAIKPFLSPKQICIPQSAVTAPLHLSVPWHLISKPLIALHGLSPPLRLFGPHLVSLELLSVESPDDFLNCLPETLLYFRVSTASHATPTASNYKLPSRLIFFLYECTFRVSEAFPFAFSSFPTSIEHIGYAATSLATPHHEDDPKEEKPNHQPWSHLHNLKHLCITQASTKMTTLLKGMGDSPIKLVGKSREETVTLMLSYMKPPSA